MTLETINFKSTPSYQIKQLIDKAGFRSITGRHGITLIDKKSNNADKNVLNN